jgi:hypothetical protein
MPRVRRGPSGPKKSQAGKKGTNKKTPHKGAGTSGKSHERYMANKGTGGSYGKGGY